MSIVRLGIKLSPIVRKVLLSAVVLIILVLIVLVVLLSLVVILVVAILVVLILVILVLVILILTIIHVNSPPFSGRILCHSGIKYTEWIVRKRWIFILITNGRIRTMKEQGHISGDILIENKTIKKIADHIDRGENRDSEIIDAKGNWVMPGLIEAHCHIGISEEKMGAEGNDCNETMKPLTPYLKALDAINPMDAAFHYAIKAGITSAMVGPGSSNVVGGQFVFMKTNGRRIDDMVVLEPAAMKIAFGENPKKNYSGNNVPPSTRMSIASMLREELTRANKYYLNKQASLESNDAFEEEFELECWIPVFKKEIPLKAHVHRADDILTAIRIAKLFDLNLTLDHCTEGHLIAESIKESGFPAILGPNLASRNKSEVKYMDFKTAGILSKAGIKVAIMTDHPVSLIQCLPLCAGLAVKAGLDMEEGLKAITINAAEICNVSSRVGSLEEGKDADIAIFDGNPMEIFTNCLYTIIDGQIAYKADGITS